MSELPDLGAFGYEVVRYLGEGATSWVYEAKQLTVAGRPVAIKLVRPGLMLADQTLERELKAAAALDHPNIIRFYDARTDEPPKFIVIEFAANGTRSGPMPLSEVLDAGVKLAGALSSAHESRIVHSDIKPGNVLWAGLATPKLSDFGTARLLDRTQLRDQLGYSPAWAPASVETTGTTKATDVWSLAATLLQFLTGKPPAEVDWSELEPDVRAAFKAAMPDQPDNPGKLGALEFAEALRDLQRLRGFEPTTIPVRHQPASRPGAAGPPPSRSSAGTTHEIIDRTKLREGRPLEGQASPTARGPRRRWATVVIVGALVGAVSAATFWQPWDTTEGEVPPDASRLTTTLRIDTTATSDATTLDEASDNASSGPVPSTETTVALPTTQPSTTQLAAVFSSDRSGNLDLFRVVGDQTSKLVDLDISAYSPTLNPTGDRVAFESSDSGVRTIYLVSTDGGDPVVISPSGSEATDPAWSPDGSTIAWVSMVNGNRDIALYDVDTATIQLATSASSDERSPSWSPDSRQILFRSDRTGDGDIYRLDLATTALTQITFDPKVEDHPALSADGTVAFERRVESDWDVFVVGAGSSEPTRVTNRPGFDGFPIYVGSSLYFVSQNESGFSWVEGPSGQRFSESAGSIRDLEAVANAG